MQFEVQVDIERPRAEVVELFRNSEVYEKWQPGFEAINHLSGSPWKDGSVSVLIYEIGPRSVQMQETIIHNDLPDRLATLYESKGMRHSITDTAIAVNPGTTLWVSQSNLSLSGLLSIIAFLRPNAFRNRRADWLQQFKSFAEGQ